MITPRLSHSRGAFDFGWLDTRHTFSFGEYQDPEHMGFGPLRVINEDRVAPGQGFGTHPHRDMEIISIVLSGALQHRDSLGHTAVLKPGEVQRISAGSGVMHSEFNPSRDEPVHFLQVWIKPRAQGLPPGYDQRSFSADTLHNRLALLVSADGRDGSIAMQQDAALYRGMLTGDAAVEHELAPGRRGWVQVASGALEVNGVKLRAGDGAAIEKETVLDLRATGEADILVFDLP